LVPRLRPDVFSIPRRTSVQHTAVTVAYGCSRDQKNRKRVAHPLLTKAGFSPSTQHFLRSSSDLTHLGYHTYRVSNGDIMAVVYCKVGGTTPVGRHLSPKLHTSWSTAYGSLCIRGCLMVNGHRSLWTISYLKNHSDCMYVGMYVCKHFIVHNNRVKNIHVKQWIKVQRRTYPYKGSLPALFVRICLSMQRKPKRERLRTQPQRSSRALPLGYSGVVWRGWWMTVQKITNHNIFLMWLVTSYLLTQGFLPAEEIIVRNGQKIINAPTLLFETCGLTRIIRQTNRY
jgi:hypothetical protein